MKMTTKRQLTLFLLVCALLAACAPQAAPIAVYITPTAQPSQVSETEAISAASSSGFTLTSIQVQTTAEPHPTVTWVGPVIGPGYVLPPSSTPLPTTPPPTQEGQPSAVPQESVTPEGTLPYQYPLPDLDPSKMGIQFDINQTQDEWNDTTRRLSGDLTLKWVKVQLLWKDMQPNAPDEIGDFFNRTKLYLQDLHLRQFKILVSIDQAPQWARSTQNQDGPPDDPQKLADFITLLLNQLGSDVDAIEIWNEPNLSREWTGTLPFTGAGYMQLFKPAYDAIRAVSPSLQIVTAGLAPTGDSAGSVDDRTFLQQMYNAGLGSYKDIAIGIHPYSWANSPDATCCGTAGWDDDPHFFFHDTLQDYRNIMVNNGDSDLQLWATEFGWATWDGFPGQPKPDSAWMLRNSKWDQANYAIRAFQIGQQTPYMGPMFLWNMNFALVSGLIANSDERIAYSIVVPGSNGQIDPNSKNTTERPLYWMIYDAVRPDVNLPKYD